MNILGHPYIATKAVSGDEQLLIIGSLLPESSPFIANSPFTWEEIHESGEKLLKFLEIHHPEKRDLALGILAHSYKFGADKFNKEVERYAGSERKTLIEEIAACSKINLKTAAIRLHNFLWWGVDLWLLQEFPEFVKEVQKAIRTVDIEGISELLAEAFQKEKEATKRVLKVLFREIYRPEDLTSVEGLVLIWARQVAGLPEKDEVDVQKATGIIQRCAVLLKNDWQSVVGLIGVRVKENLEPFIEKKGARRRNTEQEP